MELIEIKQKDNQPEVRFAYQRLNENRNWVQVPSPLTITEDKWCELLSETLENTVLSVKFLEYVYSVCNTCLDHQQPINWTYVNDNNSKCLLCTKGTVQEGYDIAAIERVFLKKRKRKEIRFVWYTDNNDKTNFIHNRPLDVTEIQFPPYLNRQ